MTAVAQNGQPKWLWWITGGLLAPLVLVVFGHEFRTTHETAQRVSAVEAITQEMRYRLERIERKLDQLLERR